MRQGPRPGPPPGGYRQPVVVTVPAARKKKKAKKKNQQRGGPAGYTAASLLVDRTTTTVSAGYQPRPPRMVEGHWVYPFNFSELASEIWTDATGAASYSLTVSPDHASSRNAILRQIFDLVHIVAFRLRYQPYTSTATKGAVIAVTDYNSGTAFPTTIADATKYEVAVPKCLWLPWVHEVKWRDRVDRETNVAPTATSHRPDGLTYTIGFLISGGPETTKVGFVMVDCLLEYNSICKN